jgi:hypothetical protein
MQIARRGARADHGESEIELTPSVAWHHRDGTLHFNARSIRDFGTSARHDYVISCSAPEAAAVIVALAQPLSDSSARDTIGTASAPRLSDLLALAPVSAETLLQPKERPA